ncbi:MAG TPA: hypothetical protein VMY42_28980 [Thermoguttaceae bacterium]|nr:hypothetical protein [Thermoguttaceae bacterium]
MIKVATHHVPKRRPMPFGSRTQDALSEGVQAPNLDEIPSEKPGFPRRILGQ